MMTYITDFISPESAGSLPGLFLKRAAISPEAIAYRSCNKKTGIWDNITWKEMVTAVARWRSGLEKEQLTQGDRVALMLPNCPEWIQFEQAALSLGLIIVPLYANDRPESIAYILKDTKAKILLCPGTLYENNLAPVITRLTTLQRIITIDFCQIDKDDSKTVCITNWLPDEKISPRRYSPVLNEIATLVYTSGTTGPPKGVMLTHDNILNNSYSSLQRMAVYPSDSFLSFLPLSHMLERTAGYYLPMMAGASVAFARSISELSEDLLHVQPTVLVAVPRIFERIHAGILTQLQAKPTLAVGLFKGAVKTGWSHFEYSQGRAPWSTSFLALPIFNFLVGKKVKRKLGGRLRIVITGGAPLSAEISKLFIGLGLPLYQGYGLTETSPVISVNTDRDNDPRGVGTPLPGIEVRTGEADELLVRGHCVMQGYWQNEKATIETIDKDGWLHTGDKAIIEANGHIRITGRIKEIIVLSNSEKVAPADMEMAIGMNPLFEHTMVIGEGRPHLTLIAVLNRSLWSELARKLAVPDKGSSLNLPKVKEDILKKAEKQLSLFPAFAFIKHVVLSLTPWTVEEGLLTPTLKLKRRVIEKQLEDQISSVYES